MNVGLFIFENMELLDFAGPYEVFTVANELRDYKLMEVFTVSHNERQIKTVNGLKVLADYSMPDCPNMDVFIIPGGIGTLEIIRNEGILDWIKDRVDRSKLSMSVCSGARILAKLGYLENREFTTHHEVVDHIKAISPNSIPVKGVRYIQNDTLYTSAGISAGIDLSLHVVEELFGKEIAHKTAEYMEYYPGGPENH